MVTCQLGEHVWVFLRALHERLPDEYGYLRRTRHNADRFYCRRCLVYVDRLPSKAPRDDAAVEPVADTIGHYVTEEREACARVVDQAAGEVGPANAARIAGAIRSRREHAGGTS